MNSCLTCGGPGQGYHGVRDIEPLQVPNLAGPGTLNEPIRTHFLNWALKHAKEYDKVITWYLVKHKLFGHRNTLCKWLDDFTKYNNKAYSMIYRSDEENEYHYSLAKDYDPNLNELLFSELITRG